MADTVKIGVDDGCAGIDTPDGRTYRFKDHVADVPRDVAHGLLRNGRTDHVHVHKPVGSGWSRRRERTLERVFGTSREG